MSVKLAICLLLKHRVKKVELRIIAYKHDVSSRLWYSRNHQVLMAQFSICVHNSDINPSYHPPIQWCNVMTCNNYSFLICLHLETKYYKYYKTCARNYISNLRIIFISPPDTYVEHNISLNYKKSSRTPRPGFSLFECFRQKLGIIFCKIAVLVFLMGQNPNVQDIIIERTKETNISSTCRPIPSTTIAGQCTRLYDVPGTHNVGLPT